MHSIYLIIIMIIQFDLVLYYKGAASTDKWSIADTA
jgi:hypothetical protein